MATPPQTPGPGGQPQQNTNHPPPVAGNRRDLPASDHPMGAVSVSQRREVFWQNVMREILSGLAAAAASSAGRLSATPSGAAQGSSPVSELFDGRLAVITRLGQRIPIADVVPMFACSMASGPGTAEDDRYDRVLSGDVQCTVFQIRTPTGEVYTLPIHEIAAFHTLSEQLIRQLQAAAAAADLATGGGNRGDVRPFGFAAFTSLAQAERDAAKAAGPASKDA